MPRLVFVLPIFSSRGGYMNTGTSQSLSGALNRQNQLMQGGGMQGGAFGRRYWSPSGHFCFVLFSFFFFFFSFFFLEISFRSGSNQFLMDTCIFLVFFFSHVWHSVILDIVKHNSLYIVCTYSTPQLSAHRNVLSLLISSAVHSDVNTHLA